MVIILQQKMVNSEQLIDSTSANVSLAQVDKGKPQAESCTRNNTAFALIVEHLRQLAKLIDK